MNTCQKGKRICCICGVKSKKEGFDLPALVFNYLEGEPCVCEKCIFKALINFLGVKFTVQSDWKEFIKQNLKEK